MTSIARTPDDLTAPWCTDMLRNAGRISDTKVTDVEVEVVGTGQLGSLVRARLGYDTPAADAPSSVVVKLASTDDGSRAMGVRTGAYEAEVRFYQQVAGTVRMALPTLRLRGGGRAGLGHDRARRSLGSHRAR